jgi:hypothetical protein
MSIRWLSLLLCSLALLLPSSASACMCLPKPEAEIIDGSEAVFWGRVVSVERPGTFDFKWPKGMWIIRFKVITAWKGSGDSELVLASDNGGSDCGIPFKKGVEYLVFAAPRSPGEPLWTSYCHSTEEFRPDSSLMKYINKHLTPLPLKPKPPPAASSCAATGAHPSWAALWLLATAALIGRQRLALSRRPMKQPRLLGCAADRRG